MAIQIQRRKILVAALAGAAFAALGITIASAHATHSGVRELIKVDSNAVTFAPLVPGTTYRAGLVQPTPSMKAAARGWLGAQFVTHQHGKVRYEWAALVWQGDRADDSREIDILSGPAMTLSPAGTLAQPRSRIPNWNFGPYEPPGPVKRWTVAGRAAMYFDATSPPPGAWSLVGSNPPELRIEHDHSFRMAAMAVQGKTVVIVVTAPAPQFAAFLPIAKRLIASLRFPPS
jgi:hypothetical protein